MFVFTLTDAVCVSSFAFLSLNIYALFTVYE